MEIENRQLSELKPYANNARIHSEQQIQQIVSSIKEFGFTNPILIDENNSVIAGHGRLSAAKIIGLEHIPTITIPGLSYEQKMAYIILDNKIALNAEWDDALLQKEMVDLASLDFDLTLMGWDENEIASFTGEAFENVFSGKEYEGAQEIMLEDIDKFEHECPRCGFNYNSQ